MPDAEVDALAKEVVDWYIEWNPIFATYVGIHDHDHRLPIGTYDAELEERARVKEFLRRVESIDRTGLSAGKRVDLGNLRNVFRIWIFESEEIGTWQSMPRGAQTVGDALFPLFMRSFAPLPQRLASITGRLERSPAYLEETKGRIRTPIKLWCEISLEAAQRVPGFLHVIEATGKEALAGPDRARLEEAVAKTGAALQDYAKWIGSAVLPKSKDKVGIGAAKFRKLVRLRELGLTVEEIYAVAVRGPQTGILHGDAGRGQARDAARTFVPGRPEHSGPRGISRTSLAAHVRELESIVRPHPGGCDGDDRGLGPLLRGHDEGGGIQRRPEDETRSAARPDLAGLPNPDRRRLAHGQDDVRRGGRPPRAGSGHGAPRCRRGGGTVHVQPGVSAVVPDRQASHHRAAQRCEEASRERILGQVVPRHDPVLRFTADEVHAGNFRSQGQGTGPVEEGRVVDRPRRFRTRPASARYLDIRRLASCATELENG